MNALFQDFTLGEFSTFNARKQGMLLVVVWKTGCSTSRMALPFFDRLQLLHPNCTVIGVSQDSKEVTSTYCRENQIGFKQAIDDQLFVTRLLEVKTVPSYWLTDQTCEVLASGAGWDKAKMEQMHELMDEGVALPIGKLFTGQDTVPAFQPG